MSAEITSFFQCFFLAALIALMLGDVELAVVVSFPIAIDSIYDAELYRGTTHINGGLIIQIDSDAERE